MSAEILNVYSLVQVVNWALQDDNYKSVLQRIENLGVLNTWRTDKYTKLKTSTEQAFN